MKRRYLPALGITLLSIAYKLFLLVFSAVTFNGDEGIVALMARHILRGERPVFFYGQAYLGATDAWLVAASFSIFGETRSQSDLSTSRFLRAWYSPRICWRGATCTASGAHARRCCGWHSRRRC
jgi:hypothetical protein